MNRRELLLDAAACRAVAEQLRAMRWMCSSDRQRLVLDTNVQTNEAHAVRLEREAEALIVPK